MNIKQDYGKLVMPFIALLALSGVLIWIVPNGAIAYFDNSHSTSDNPTTPPGQNNEIIFGPNRRVSGGGRGDESMPDLEIGPGNVLYLVWEDERAGHADIYFAKSTDGGTTWTGETRLNTDDTLTMQRNPNLELDDTGNLYLIWEDLRGGDRNGDIYFAKSTNGGATWSAEVRVNDRPNSVNYVAGEEFKSVMDLTVRGGIIYVAWGYDYSADDYVYFDYSTDDGTTWNIDRNNLRDTDSQPTYNTTLGVDDNGVIYTIWNDRRAGNDGPELSYFVRSEDGGQVWTTNQPVNSNNGQNQRSQELLVLGNGELCLVWAEEPTNSYIYSARSTDKGQTWSARTRITQNNTKQSLVDVAYGRDGDLYAVWEDRRSLDGVSYNLFIAVSTDACQSWTEKGRVNPIVNDVALDASQPNIEATSSGDLYVAWATADNHIEVAKSSDGGYTWTANKVSSQPTTAEEERTPAVVAKPDGSAVYTLFRGNTANGSDIFFTVSADQWQTNSDNIAVTDNGGAGNPETPVLAYGEENTLYAAWTDGRSGNLDIFFARSTDGGANWSPNQKITGAGPQQNPAIAADGDNVCLIWEDRRNGSDADIYTRCSSNGGQSWHIEQDAIVPLESSEQMTPTLAVKGNQIFIAWVEDAGQIFFAYNTDLWRPWTANHQVHDGAGGITDAPSLDVGNSGKICVAWEEYPDDLDERDIYVSCSVDNGATWSSVVNAIHETSNAAQYAPTLHYDPTGRWHLLWRDGRRRNGSTDPDICHAHSDDGDTFWSSNQRVIDEVDRAYNTQMAPAMALDNLGRVYAVWEDDRRAGSEIYGATSLDLPLPPAPLTAYPTLPPETPPVDTAFGPNRKVSDNGEYLQDNSEIGIAPDGTLYMVWDDRRNGSLDIFFAKSPAGGVTWVGYTQVNSADTANQFEPHLAVDDSGTIYVIWQDSRLGATDVYFARSTDGGATWSNESRLNDVQGSSYSRDRSALDIATYSSGVVYVIWIDTRTSDDHVFLDYSTDSGQTWHTDQELNPIGADSADPSLAVDGNGIPYVIWFDDWQSGSDFIAWGNGNLCAVWEPEGTDQIYSQTSTDKGASWSSAQPVDSSGDNQETARLARNPANGDIYTAWSDGRGSGSNVFSALSTDGCQSWTAKGMMNVEGDAESDSFPSVVYGPDNTLFMSWINDTDYQAVYASHSPNNGTSWTDIRVKTLVNGQDQTVPSLAVEPDGSKAYVAFVGTPDNNNSDLYATYSTDGWQTRNPDVSITDNHGEGSPNNGVLAVGAPGYLYATWEDSRYSSTDIFFAFSTDGGLSWSNNKQLNLTMSNNQQDPSLAITNGDDLCAAWESYQSGNYDIYVRCSTTGGVNWGPEQNITSATNGNNQLNPTITAQGNNLYVAWQDNREGVTHIYFAHSGDFGATWSNNIKVDDGSGNVDNPSIDVDDAGRICIAWDDRRVSGDKDIYVSCSTNNGASWSANVNAIQEPGIAEQHSPSLRYAGYWRLAWGDRRNGWDIYYAESAAGSSWGTNIRVVDLPATNGSADLPSLAVDHNFGNSHLVWQDKRTGYNNIYFAGTIKTRPRFTGVLQVSTHLDLGQTALARFDVVNDTASPLTFSKLYVQAEHSSGHLYNFPVASNITLAPGEKYIYNQSQLFEAAGAYTAMAGYDNGSGFQPLTSIVNNPTPFTVSMLEVNLVQPNNGTLVCDDRTTFDWTNVVSAAGYFLQLGDTAPIDVANVSRSASLSEDKTYEWHVQSYDAWGTSSDWSETWALTVDTTAPESPLLTRPLAGEVFTNTVPVFEWEENSGGAVGYEFELDGSVSVITQSIYTMSMSLPSGGHTWRVRAYDACLHYSTWSSQQTFTLMTPISSPQLTGPSPNATLCSDTAHFEWSEVEGASGYELQVDGGVAVPITGTHSYTRSGLSHDTHIWAVRAVTLPNNYSPWVTSTFTADLTPPVTPTLSQPSEGAILYDPRPVFDWTDSISATNYEIELAGEVYTTTSSSYTPTTALSFQPYTWKVRAYDSCSASAWTLASYFTLHQRIYSPLIFKESVNSVEENKND